MTEFYESVDVYSLKRLKQKLNERYKDHLYYTDLPGRADIVCFKNMTDHILSNFKRKPTQTKDDILNAAAKLVKADIRDLQQSKEWYPSTVDISCETVTSRWVPESLSKFLQYLIPSKLKSKSIGQV